MTSIAKPVYLTGCTIGHAATWGGVALALGQLFGKEFDGVLLQQHGSEGPDGFYLSDSAVLTGFTRVAVS
jgi:hypothetical protein